MSRLKTILANVIYFATLKLNFWLPKTNSIINFKVDSCPDGKVILKLIDHQFNLPIVYVSMSPDYVKSLVESLVCASAQTETLH